MHAKSCKPFLSCLSISQSHISCRWFFQGPHGRPHAQSWKTFLSCLSVSLSHLSCRCFLPGPPWQIACSILKKPSCPVSLSLCLSASLPLVPSGTPGRPHAQSWKTFLSCLSVSLPSCRWFLQGPLADRTLNPEKLSCLVSLSLCLRAAALVPSGTPGRSHAQSWKAFLPYIFVSLSLCLLASCSFRDPWQTARSILKNLPVLSLCLSISPFVPLVPSGTPWQSACLGLKRTHCYVYKRISSSA